MLKLTLLAVVTVAVVMAVPRPDDEHYKSRLDSINVDEVIANDRLFDAYVKCFLEKENVKCTPDGKNLREQLHQILKEILETNCAKCTKEQRAKGRKILRHLHDHKPEAYNELLDKFDKDKSLRKEYKEKYSGLAKEEGFADIFD